MLNKFLPWILLGITLFILLGIGIKSCNRIPEINPYELRLNELEKKLYIEKGKSNSLDKEAKKWEKLYWEESKKPKKIIKITHEKVDSIKHLSLDSSAKYFSVWTKLAPPGIPE